VNDFIVATLRYGTPLVYVTMAGVPRRAPASGTLGLEGLMIIGACAVVLGLVQTGSLTVGLAIAILVCVLGSVLLWFVIEKLRANPIIAGLGLTGLGSAAPTLPCRRSTAAVAVNTPVAFPVWARSSAQVSAHGVLSVLVVLMPLSSSALSSSAARFGL
jgi:simple sugar transport system permease protein